MNTKIILVFAAMLAAGNLQATDAAKSTCCAAAPAGQEAATFSAHSLYQSDSTWTSDAGEVVRLGSFRGRPVVVAMFFAHCEYACPMLVSDLQRLRNSLPVHAREQTRFLLVTFDSERDTPAALKAYRERAALDGGWTLLHGNEGDVQELAMLLGVKYKKDARGQFSHSNLITVLNAEGEIVHQRTGLMGDVSESAKAVALVSP